MEWSRLPCTFAHSEARINQTAAVARRRQTALQQASTISDLPHCADATDVLITGDSAGGVAALNSAGPLKSMLQPQLPRCDLDPQPSRACPRPH